MRSGPMLGFMMDVPLLLSGLIDYASRYHGDTEVVGCNIDGSLERTNWSAMHGRSARLGNALINEGYGVDTLLASLAWNTTNHVELLYGACGVGASLHTLNPRLSEEHLIYMINKVGDELVFVDADTLPLAEKVFQQTPCVKKWIYLDEGESLPESKLPN